MSAPCCHSPADLPPGHASQHLKVLVCEVLTREYYHCAARSTNTCEVTLFSQGLHDNPEICRQTLQPAVDAADPKRFAAVVLGYGLCNNALAGLRAGRTPLVVPRAHDCITLFLGCRRRYAQVFAEQPGTYFYTSGWLEYPYRGGERVQYTQSSGLARRRKFDELAAEYGEENAAFLVETMSAWEVNYKRGLYIRMGFCERLGYEERVRSVCREKGWEYAEVEGDLSLVQDSLDGRWDSDRFLVLEPGEEIAADYGEGILRAKPRTAAQDG
ncbi:MAG TPA: DUF1638 domain-containing protein, partial [Candidatus Brocadiia bacterium]|nr:DUF1638 domain-containing protein [Candidatus Brocadiia bacterium]